MTIRGRILILDGQTNQALACIRSLARAGYLVFVASNQWWPLAAWSRYSKGHFHIDGETIEAFAQLRRWSIKKGIDIVLPLTERSCILCNAQRQEWERCGIIIGCGPHDMLMRSFDKAQTMKLAKECGVRTPQTFFPNSLEECRRATDEIGFPCVIKQRFSNAWNGSAFLPVLGCAYADNNPELDKAVLSHKQYGFWPLIQEYIEGQGKGIFALYNHGKAVAWFAHQRLRDVRPTGSGSSLRQSVKIAPRLKEASERLLSYLNWHGPVMIEFREDSLQSPCLMEINGRFWNSLQLSIDAGVDFPRMWVDILKTREIAPVTAYVTGVTLRWVWGDVKRFLYIMKGKPSGYKGPYPTVWQGLKELFGPQPRGTRSETFRKDDPWPAVGEWIQGIREIFCKRKNGTHISART